MKKIIITETQYSKILLFEKNNRALITESREVLYGIAKLMDVKLSGMNLEVANKALDDEKVLKNILTTLEDDNKFDTLVGEMESKGMENAKDKLLKHGDSIVNKFNNICEKKGLTDRMNEFIFDRSSLK